MFGSVSVYVSVYVCDFVDLDMSLPYCTPPFVFGSTNTITYARVIIFHEWGVWRIVVQTSVHWYKVTSSVRKSTVWNRQWFRALEHLISIPSFLRFVKRNFVSL